MSKTVKSSFDNLHFQNVQQALQACEAIFKLLPHNKGNIVWLATCTTSVFFYTQICKRSIVGFAIVFALLIAISGCGEQKSNTGPIYSDSSFIQKKPIYHFAVVALNNPGKLLQQYQPLIDYLNQKISEVDFALEASRNYARFEHKYKDRKPEFILPNPWQTLQAIKAGYKVIATAGDSFDFRGLLIVRKDAGINHPADLIGKVVSYPASTAMAACIMPQYFLHTQGINVNKDIVNLYVGSQQSSIMNVYLKNTAAAGSWPPAWRDFQKENPAAAEELVVKWETAALINNSVMARNDIPANIVEAVKNCLIELHETGQGKKILADMYIASFLPAGNKDYDEVQLYINRFEKEIRKIGEQ